MRIAIMHPGEMGAAVGAALVEIGHVVVWLPQGRSPATARRAQAAGLRPVDDLSGCEVVMSVCPPGSASAVARSVSGFRGLYLDANAIAPQTALRVAAETTASGMTYVDGGIIGPPPTRSGTTRLYLSGPPAPVAAALFDGSRLDARVLSEAGPTAASALKMAYAAWTKIGSALLIAVDGAADRLGLTQALREEWALSQPDLAERLDRALTSADAKGWRWSAEMREIAATFAAVDEPSGFGAAAAEVFSRYPPPRPDGPAGVPPDASPGSWDPRRS